MDGLPTQVGVGLALFLAALTQAVTGFGSALLAMPLLAQVIGVKLGASVLALVSLPLNLALLLAQRTALRLGAVWRLALAAVIGIPLGILSGRVINERGLAVGLGVLLIGYAVYALVTPRLPELRGAGWSYAFGWLSGILAGAYNIGGPPAIVYASSRRWEPPEFRSNLQALFFVENIVVLIGRAGNGEFTPDVLQWLWVALPALGLGILLGLLLDRFLPAAAFRKLVPLLLILLGARLVIP